VDYNRTIMPSKTRKASRTRKRSRTSKVRIPISRSGELGKYGYKNILKTPEKKRREALMKVVKSVGKDTQAQIAKAGKIIQKLNALAIVQKNRQPEFARRVRRDQKFMSRVLDDLKKNYRRIE
jgi:hypothetical protein